jgi:purine-binding chemotaxis protein CheW
MSDPDAVKPISNTAPTSSGGSGGENALALAETGAGLSRYVVVEINASRYGFNTDSTVELRSGASIEVTRVPKSPRYVDGVINHRGSIIPVVDTRVLLGLPSAADQGRELIASLNRWDHDYAAWIDSVEPAIRGGDDVAAAPNPARWVKDTLADPRRLLILTRYDPTAADSLETIRKLGTEVIRIGTELGNTARADKDAAIARSGTLREQQITEVHSVFKQLIKAARGGLRSMLVITELGDRRAAFVVDAVHTVKDCAQSDIDPLPDSASGTDFLRGLVHQPDGNYILICDLEKMYELACPR